jgi:small subunit ribosomal protein S2
MKFHAPSSPWYARTNAEVWFRTAEAAEAAGFANAESGETTEAPAEA